MSSNRERDRAVQSLVALAKQETSHAISRQNLGVILKNLIDVATHKSWWSQADFPNPAPDELQARYLIHEEPGSTYVLYLNVMKPGNKIVPHNHTTWACIAAVEGTETNYLFTRTDDGMQPGHATIEQTGVKAVSPGGGIALLADDIHAVHIEGGAIRHLHMYGLGLEKLTERLAFDRENNTCYVKPIGVKTRRGAN